MFGWGNPVKRFWKKVRRYASRYQKKQISSHLFCYKVDMALHRYDCRLKIEVMESIPDSCRKIIITADGNVAAFPSVSALSDQAPELPGWEFLFLKPAMHNMGAVDVDDATRVAVDEVWFRHSSTGNRIDLDLFVQNMSEGSRPYFEDGARCLVLCLLGEYFFGTRIGSIQYFPFSEEQDLHPLRKICSVLGSEPTSR